MIFYFGSNDCRYDDWRYVVRLRKTNDNQNIHIIICNILEYRIYICIVVPKRTILIAEFELQEQLGSYVSHRNRTEAKQSFVDL